jgi:hypothetical protein
MLFLLERRTGICIVSEVFGEPREMAVAVELVLLGLTMGLLLIAVLVEATCCIIPSMYLACLTATCPRGANVAPPTEESGGRREYVAL